MGEPNTFSREQLEVLWQNLSEASEEVRSVRASETARQAEAEERVLAARQQVSELEQFRTELALELENVSRARDEAHAALQARATDAETSTSQLAEALDRLRTIQSALDARTQELESTSARARELEGLAAERHDQIQTLKAAEANLVRAQNELALQLRTSLEERDRVLAKAVHVESEAAQASQLRARVALLEAESSAAQRAHAEMTTVLRERLATLEDTLSKTTAAFETLVRERGEADRRHQGQLEELGTLRLELARRETLVADVSGLREELAKRDALLAELATRRAAPTAPKPRRPRSRPAKSQGADAIGAEAGASVPPASVGPGRGELPSV